MKRLSRSSISRLAVGLALATVVASVSVSAQTTLPGGDSCEWGGVAGAGRIQHFDKIVFRPDPGNNFICPAGTLDPDNAQPFRIHDERSFDIKIPDDPTRVANVEEKVAAFLNSLGCQKGKGGDILWQQIEVIDVEYSSECVAACPCAEEFKDIRFEGLEG